MAKSGKENNGANLGFEDKLWAAADSSVPFEEKKAKLTAELYAQFEESHRLEAAIRKNLEALGFGK